MWRPLTFAFLSPNTEPSDTVTVEMTPSLPCGRKKCTKLCPNPQLVPRGHRWYCLEHLKCVECPAGKSNKAFRNYDGNPLLDCDICEMGYHFKCARKYPEYAHSAVPSKEEMWACPRCYKRFTTIDALVREGLGHTGVNVTSLLSTALEST